MVNREYIEFIEKCIRYLRAPETPWLYKNRKLRHRVRIVLYDEQDGKCYLCEVAKSIRHPNTRQMLYVDHSHVSGYIRALLCEYCNGFLWSFRDDADEMQDFLNRFEKW